MKTLSYEAYQEKVKNLKTSGDVTNFAKELIAPTLQNMLEAEMEDHLGYPKHASKGKGSGNSRNGHSTKKLKTSFGTEELKVPRDRKGEFDPVAVRKYQTVENDVEEKIIAMYGKGLSTRDIYTYMKDIYGIEISAGMVSNITDKVLPIIQEWQSRPLAEVYAIVYLDGIHFKVRDGGRIVNRCCYTALGISAEGKKDLLGLWIDQSEGSKFWMGVLSEIKSRGTQDILICCTDGLKGFAEAIKAVYPETCIQRCIVHQVRHTSKHIPHRDKKDFCQDLKAIYTAPTEESGIAALEAAQEKWPQYEVYLRSWEANWGELSALFSFPEEIRRVIYTTNAVEGLHRQFRKVTKTTTIFPHDESLKKILWLAQKDISRKWTAPIRNWGIILPQLTILFPDKIKL